MNYRDLTIHQRITCKANALFFNWNYMVLAARHHGSKPLNLLKRVVDRDANLFEPTIPYYVIHFKTNSHD